MDPSGKRGKMGSGRGTKREREEAAELESSAADDISFLGKPTILFQVSLNLMLIDGFWFRSVRQEMI